MSSGEIAPPVKTFFLSVQHVLAMYAAAVVVPLIVGRSIGLNQEQLTYLIAIDIFMCGVATILQTMKNRFFGIGLPIVLGCTFTAVGPMIAIGNTYGITAIYGAIIHERDCRRKFDRDRTESFFLASQASGIVSSGVGIGKRKPISAFFAKYQI